MLVRSKARGVYIFFAVNFHDALQKRNDVNNSTSYSTVKMTRLQIVHSVYYFGYMHTAEIVFIN